MGSETKKPAQGGLWGVGMELFGIELPTFLVWKLVALCCVVAVWKFFEALLGGGHGRGLVAPKAKELGQGEPAQLGDGRAQGDAAHVHEVAELRRRR